MVAGFAIGLAIPFFPFRHLGGTILGLFIYQIVVCSYFWGKRRGDFEYIYRELFLERFLKQIIIKKCGRITYYRFYFDQFNSISSYQWEICQRLLSDKEILNAIYQEDIQPANWESDPISRFILLKGTDGINVIVVYIHHTISDGRAVTFVTNHLLEFIANSDKQVDPLKPISLTTNAPPDVKIPGILKPLMNIINKKWKSTHQAYKRNTS